MTVAHPSLQQMRVELHVGEEFLANCNRPGPRYTSYPTAPVWTDGFGPADLERVHDEAERAKTPVSLYMHIPFCKSLCLFCACNVVIEKNKAVSPPYLGILKREAERVSRSVSNDRPVVQFHWGGGTPTYLTPPQIEDLFGFTREHFHFAPDAEIGIEIDPRVTSREHLETLRKLGFNRLSMGIQDFHADVQKAIHRIQPFEMTRDLLFAARDLGFDSINVDLIYGLPYQTPDRTLMAWQSPPSAAFKTPPRKTIATSPPGKKPSPPAALPPCAAITFRARTASAAPSSIACFAIPS